MSEFENKYAEVLSHFTEPDVPLKPDALIEAEENTSGEAVPPAEDNTAETAEKDTSNIPDNEKAEPDAITYEPLTEETTASIMTPVHKKIPWKKLLISAAALAVAAGVIISVPKGGGKDDVTLFTDGMISFAKKDAETLSTLYGVINKRGKVIANPDYSMTFLPGEKVILAAEGNDSVSFYTGSGAAMALLDSYGNEMTEFFIEDTTGEFSEKLMAASKEEKWGFLNPKGKWVIEPKYAGAHSFSEGLAGVRHNKNLMWGFVDKKGKKVIDYKFQEIGLFSDSIAPAKLNDKWGYIDKKGNWVIKNKFSDVGEFDNGRAIAVNAKGKWGFIDKEGNWVIKPQYEELRDFSNSAAAAKKDGKWGYIDKKGNWIIENKYALAGDFKQGLAYVQKEIGDKFGYINQKGETKIKAAYDMASSFTQGIALIKTEKGFGYINKKGEPVTKDNFNTATVFFDDGYAAVCEEDSSSPSGEKWYIINRRGKKIFKKTFDGIY